MVKKKQPDGITTQWEDMCHTKNSIWFCTRLKGHNRKHKCYDGFGEFVCEWI